ncbi:MAG: hypothetical protein ACREVL_06555 [Solimonas sp.]
MPFSFLYVLIVACEAAFWLVLMLGLYARYGLRRRRLGAGLLLSLPLIDLLLLVCTAADLKSGTPAGFAHGLAAAYVGFTVAFGSLLVRWADAVFARRFLGHAPAVAAPTRGWAVVRYESLLWLRCIVAWIIALALLEALVAYVGDAAATAPLQRWYRIGFGCVFFWFVFGPAWSLLFQSWRPRQT